MNAPLSSVPFSTSSRAAFDDDIVLCFMKILGTHLLYDDDDDDDNDDDDDEDNNDDDDDDEEEDNDDEVGVVRVWSEYPFVPIELLTFLIFSVKLVSLLLKVIAALASKKPEVNEGFSMHTYIMLSIPSLTYDPASCTAV